MDRTTATGVYTYPNDAARDGANHQEYALDATNANASKFGIVAKCPADGAIYAQSLWVANLTVKGAKHYVVFVATEHNGVFAYDADTNLCTTTGILYVVSKSTTNTPADVAAGNGHNYVSCVQRLHAIDITTGHERAGSPIVISGTYPSIADGGTRVTFNSQQQLQRTGLALTNGVAYVAFTAHEDRTPWYGWMMSYQYSGGAGCGFT